MTRSSVCILGGTGFVGRHLAARLTQKNFDVKILTRSRARHYGLLVLPSVTLVEADVHDAAVLRREFAGCDGVINLVGILNERGHRGKGFHRVHVELVRKILAACRTSGVSRLLHMSALNAGEQAPSHYLRTKGEAAALVLKAADELRVTVFEPSVIFGADDSFINRFAALLRKMPGVFPLACARAKFAPAYAGDVAEALVRSWDNHASFGRRYSLCGPGTYTLRELVRETARVMGLRRAVIGLPAALSWLQAALMEWLPGKPFSLDNYRSLKLDSVCDHNGFAAFGIKPVSLEAVLPTCLGNRTAQAERERLRGRHNQAV
ncbi:MAG: complex I NDUFA9 subunit family protein [Gammaproteobacteria bacterium]